MSSFSYDFSVLGGDARQVFLAEMLAESGRSLCHYALASQPNNCSSVSEHVSIVREAPSLEEACIHSGSVICPFPFTKNGADVSVENSIYRFSIQTLLHLLRPGQSLFAGGIPSSFKKEAAENNVAVFDYADDISLPVYNSISTAEGAICEAILHSPFNLHKSRCAVLGFGKCGHSIVYRLKGLSANVSVFTDNAEESARAFTSLFAMLDVTEAKKTGCCLLVDKEEIGSVGATGMHSRFFENTVAELIAVTEGESELKVRRALSNSKMLSSDVSAAFDPMFAEAFEKRSSAFFANGITFNKFTGSRGKSGSNDANGEYIAALRRTMDEAQVAYQFAELGRVDLGGGGTIAYIMANYGMEVIDSGVAVLNMHAPYEVSSKADVYEAVKGYRAFLRME